MRYLIRRIQPVTHILRQVRNTAALVLLLMPGYLLGIDHGVVLLLSEGLTRSSCLRLLGRMRLQRRHIIKELPLYYFALLYMLFLSSLSFLQSLELALDIKVLLL